MLRKKAYTLNTNVRKCKKKQEMHKIPICSTDTCLFLSFLHFKLYTNIHSYTVSKLRSSSLHLHLCNVTINIGLQVLDGNPQSDPHNKQQQREKPLFNRNKP